jgi:hypothetical protein
MTLIWPTTPVGCPVLVVAPGIDIHGNRGGIAVRVVTPAFRPAMFCCLGWRSHLQLHKAVYPCHRGSYVLQNPSLLIQALVGFLHGISQAIQSVVDICRCNSSVCSIHHLRRAKLIQADPLCL